MGNRTRQRAAAVFSNANHTLQLVDVTVLAEQETPGTWRCDEREAKLLGLERLREAKPGESWDYVGTLFATVGGLDKGLINWGKDFDRVEVLA